MKKWLNHSFTSSSIRTPEFISFEKDFVKELKKQLNDEFEMHGFRNGHFYISGFLVNRNTNKVVYISISDVRFFPDEWYNNVLIRKAKDIKDYTGGSNNKCEFNKIYKFALMYTQ
jgi:hypothetical protein